MIRLPRCAPLLAACVLSAAPGLAGAQTLITNGNFESFSGGVPTGWTYLQESGGPASVQSTALVSPFTNVYPAGANAVRLTDQAPLNALPALRQNIATQTGVLSLGFDFYLDDPSPKHQAIRALLGFDTGTQTNFPFNINIDQVIQQFQLIGSTNQATPIQAQTWYQFRGQYDVLGRTLSGTLTPFGGSPVSLGITTLGQSQGVNFLEFEMDSNAGSASPIVFDNAVLAPVPEPSVLALVGLAAVGAITHGLRRRRAEHPGMGP